MRSKFNTNNYLIKIFSIGAYNEDHGKALPPNIDDFIARHLALRLSEEIRADYVGHLPYCGDREGKNAQDWNPGVMEKQVVVNGIISDIKYEINKRSNLKLSPPLCIVVVGGHGGNNYLLEEQEKIKLITNIPFLYIPPFKQIRINHKKYGQLEITHADHAEHSIAEYLDLLDQKNLLTINRLAKKDPMMAIKENPAIMGLAGYVLPELGGVKYESLRKRHPELVRMAKKFIQKDKKIIVDKHIGKLFIDMAINNAKKEIQSFIKANTHLI